MKKLYYAIVFALIILFAAPAAHSQVLVSDIPAATADASAMLDVQSTSKGFLFPRMNETQRDNISNPPTGLVIFQTSATSGFYYNKGLPASPSWERLKESSEIGGLWSPGVGSEIYYTAGNVGIGNASPANALDVVGDVYVSGSPGTIGINATSGNEPRLDFGYEGSSMFNLNIDLPASSPYLSVSTDSYSDVWGVSTVGRVWHSYQGSVQAYVLLADVESSALYIDNNSNNNGARGINAAVSDASATDTATLAIGGWDLGSGSGVYGQQGDPLAGDNPNFGYLGTSNHGAYGQYGANSNHGLLGSVNYGAFGIYDSESFAGYLGTDFSGVLGTLGGASQNLDNGDFGVVGYGVFNSSESGSSLGTGGSIGAVLGTNNVGVDYSFGVLGYSPSSGVSSGGVMGIKGSSDWGALGYRSGGGGQVYGGYFQGGVVGDNKSPTNTPSTDIGIGAFGDLFGAHINGNIYGLYAEGENYGSYTHGDVYRTGADVHLQMDNAGTNNVMYTLVSPEMTVQTYGIGQMQNGKASIVFDEAFANIVSSSEPIIVTITPIGKSKGVYLDAVDSDGFRVEENENGKSNIQFTWIAIGKRAGYENISLPADVIASDYNEKIKRGLSIDGDPSTPDGEGLYYQNGELHLGQPVVPRTYSNTAIKHAELDNNTGQDKENLKKAPVKYNRTPDKGIEQEK